MTKKQIQPGVFIAVIAAVVVIVAAWFHFGTGVPSGKVDMGKVDLRDEDPPRPGQPGYQERTTDQSPR